mmetsp:Transcript_4104/g.14365  ORF Transcript_4104/g.14365 Transcript_4104/m.14365 type:complete len:226 (-) Transcript_4104:268-945(-)
MARAPQMHGVRREAARRDAAVDEVLGHGRRARRARVRVARRRRVRRVRGKGRRRRVRRVAVRVRRRRRRRAAAAREVYPARGDDGRRRRLERGEREGDAARAIGEGVVEGGEGGGAADDDAIPPRDRGRASTGALRQLAAAAGTRPRVRTRGRVVLISLASVRTEGVSVRSRAAPRVITPGVSPFSRASRSAPPPRRSSPPPRSRSAPRSSPASSPRRPPQPRVR